MPMSDYSGNKILDDLLGNTALSPPATYYIAIYTAAPSGSGGGTEVSGGSYVRLTMTNNSTNFPSASGDIKSNGTAWTFATASTNWGTIVAWALFDASTSGNMWFWGNLATSRPVNSGDVLIFPVGSVQWQAIADIS
jgi:hypothetical protein